jgi:hypothetical protein
MQWARILYDINNDGLSDVVELDMNPKDNYRKKMMLPTNNYNTFQNFDFYGHQFQYIRNTLQLNQGPSLLENDSIGPPVFQRNRFSKWYRRNRLELDAIDTGF